MYFSVKEGLLKFHITKLLLTTALERPQIACLLQTKSSFKAMYSPWIKREISNMHSKVKIIIHIPPCPLCFSVCWSNLTANKKKTGNFIDTIISCLLLGNVPISSVCLKASLSSYSPFTCCYIWCSPLFLCLFEFIVLVLIITGRPKNKKPFLARHIDFNVNEGKKKIDLIFKKKINLLHI